VIVIAGDREASCRSSTSFCEVVLNSLSTVALGPRLPPCPRGALKVHARFADKHPAQGCEPLHLVLRRRHASHAFDTTFRVLVALFCIKLECLSGVHGSNLSWEAWWIGVPARRVIPVAEIAYVTQQARISY
jgi:hypothetical protein